jgi:hypothetical protein
VLSHFLNFAQSLFGFCHSAQSFYVFIGDFVISSVILGFPLSFCEAQQQRRQGHWRERHWMQEDAALASGDMRGGGGRGAHRWWGGVRCSRKRRSPVGEAWGRGGRGVMSGDAGLGGMGSGVTGRSGNAGLDGAGSGVAVSFGQRGVGRAGRMRTGVGQSVGPLGPGNGSLVHHHR